MIKVNTTEVNLFGKFFRKPVVSADSESIWFSKNGTTVSRYPLQNMRAFACTEESMLGG